MHADHMTICSPCPPGPCCCVQLRHVGRGGHLRQHAAPVSTWQGPVHLEAGSSSTTTTTQDWREQELGHWTNGCLRAQHGSMGPSNRGIWGHWRVGTADLCSRLIPCIPAITRYEVELQNRGKIDVYYQLLHTDTPFGRKFSFEPSSGHLAGGQIQVRSAQRQPGGCMGWGLGCICARRGKRAQGQWFVGILGWGWSLSMCGFIRSLPTRPDPPGPLRSPSRSSCCRTCWARLTRPSSGPSAAPACRCCCSSRAACAGPAARWTQSCWTTASYRTALGVCGSLACMAGARLHR